MAKRLRANQGSAETVDSPSCGSRRGETRAVSGSNSGAEIFDASCARSIDGSPLRAVGYICVSDGSAEQDIAREFTRKFVGLAASRLVSLGRLYLDPRKAAPPCRRPELLAMTRAAHAGEFEVLVIDDVDRLARATDIWTIIEDLDGLDVAVMEVSNGNVISRITIMTHGLVAFPTGDIFPRRNNYKPRRTLRFC
jgi:hypothetical protein